MSRPDPALGVLETIGVQAGRPLLLGEHLARLRASVRAVYGARVGEELEACVAHALAGHPDAAPDRGPPGRPADAPATHGRWTPGELASHDGPPARGHRAPREVGADGRLRVIWAPGRPVRAQLAPPGVGPGPVVLRPWTLPGGLGAHKWADRRLVDAATERLGATPLILDADGTVLEAAWGNVWALEGRRLVTPPADGRLLAGVTRAQLQRVVRRLGFEAVEEPLNVARLQAAEAILVTSAVRLAVPGQLGPAPVDPQPAAAIAAALRDAAR